jgi:hypothetical protein
MKPIQFDNRNSLVSHYIKPESVGAELGVFVGDFSEVLLSLSPRKLYLVDMFEGMHLSADHNGNNFRRVCLDTARNNLLEKYRDESRIEVVKTTTIDFLTSLPDDSLDFVYIDADHSYEAVASDIRLSCRKVKLNGHIMGHDYTTRLFPGVVRAVDEFCHEKALSIEALSNCGCPSFCIPVVSKGT